MGSEMRSTVVRWLSFESRLDSTMIHICFVKAVCHLAHSGSLPAFASVEFHRAACVDINELHH